MDTVKLISQISGALTQRATGVTVTDLQSDEALALVARAARLEDHVANTLASRGGVSFALPDEDEVSPDKIDTGMARLELSCCGCFDGRKRPVDLWLISTPNSGHMQFDVQCTFGSCNENHLSIDLDRLPSRNDNVSSVCFDLTWGELLADDAYPVRLGVVDGERVSYVALLPMSVDEVAERIGMSFTRHVDLCMQSLHKVRAMAKR
jgi:hypothetical protein